MTSAALWVRSTYPVNYLLGRVGMFLPLKGSTCNQRCKECFFLWNVWCLWRERRRDLVGHMPCAAVHCSVWMCPPAGWAAGEAWVQLLPLSLKCHFRGPCAAQGWGRVREPELYVWGEQTQPFWQRRPPPGPVQPPACFNYILWAWERFFHLLLLFGSSRAGAQRLSVRNTLRQWLCLTLNENL